MSFQEELYMDLKKDLLNRDDNMNECKKELNDLICLQEDINHLLLTQDDKINDINKIIEKADNDVLKGKEEVKKAHKIYWKKYGVISAGLVGTAIGFPVGLFGLGLQGISLAGVTVGTGVLSGIGAKALSKKNNNKVKI